MPAPSSPTPWLVPLTSFFGQPVLVGRIAEFREAAFEPQPLLPGAAVAVLGDDQLRHPCDLAVLGFPFLERGEDLDRVAGDRVLRLVRPEIIFLAIDEEHDVGVLLDRARLAKVGELRALVLALLNRTAEL